MVSLISIATEARGIGVLGYTAATVTCAYAWQRTAQKQAWLMLTAIQLFLLLDLIFNWRWKLHNHIVDAAEADNLYQERRSPQAIVLAIVFLAMIALVIYLWRRFRQRAGLTIAIAATVLSVAVRVAELISLHQSDTVLHHPVAGVMLVTYIWFALGIATAAGVWTAIRYPAMGLR